MIVGSFIAKFCPTSIIFICEGNLGFKGNLFEVFSNDCHGMFAPVRSYRA
jgi:hypothetical protein